MGKEDENINITFIHTWDPDLKIGLRGWVVNMLED